MCPLPTNNGTSLQDQLSFITREYQAHLNSYARLEEEYGTLRADDWGKGLQRKIQLLSALRESMKELIYLKGIRP
jgi:hypothetical protein